MLSSANGQGYYDANDVKISWQDAFDLGLSDANTTPNDHVGNGYSCGAAADGKIKCNLVTADDEPYVCISCKNNVPDPRSILISYKENKGVIF